MADTDDLQGRVDAAEAEFRRYRRAAEQAAIWQRSSLEEKASRFELECSVREALKELPEPVLERMESIIEFITGAEGEWTIVCDQNGKPIPVRVTQERSNA